MKRSLFWRSTPDELALALTRLGDLALDSLQIIDAETLAEQRYPHLDPAAPVLVLGLANVDQVTSDRDGFAAGLSGFAPCALLDDAGRYELTLGELSQVALASGAGLWIAPLATPGEYAALQDVVARAARAGRLPVGSRADLGKNARLGAGGSARAARCAGRR